jgi:hypothetical protein
LGGCFLQRGGGGNVYKEKYGGHSSAPKEGLGDKVKHLFGKDHKEKGKEEI